MGEHYTRRKTGKKRSMVRGERASGRTLENRSANLRAGLGTTRCPTDASKSGRRIEVGESLAYRRHLLVGEHDVARGRIL